MSTAESASTALAGRRLLILSPFGPGAGRGNRTSAERAALRLTEAGAATRIVAPAASRDCSEIEDALVDFRPDGLHAVHVGHLARTLDALAEEPRAQALALPLVLAIGGNDMFEDLELEADSLPDEPAVRRHAQELLAHAGMVLCATPCQVTHLAGLLGSRERLRLLPKYPEVGHAPLPSVAAAIDGRAPVLVWCGTLRRQKRPEWILPIHRELVSRFPDLVTLVAGPAPIGAAEQALSGTLAGEPGIALLPPYASGPTAAGGAVGSLLARTDLVLNTSRTEGMANFLLEALHECVPVLAARTPGNRDWIRDQAGLFDEPEQAIAAAMRLLADDELRRDLGQRGRTWLEAQASPAAETRVLVEAHRLATAARASSD